MITSKFILYFAPGTCARVPMTCLEEAGVDYESRVVAFKSQETWTADFLSLNPAGKVPLLLIDREPLSENVAILSYLAEHFPDAGILPKVTTAWDKAKQVSDLSFCASVLHPIVTRLRLPEKFTLIEEARGDVLSMAAKAMIPYFEHIDDHLNDNGPWWYGDEWSAVDSYINWVWFRVTGSEFPSNSYIHFAAHAERIAQRPAHQRCLAREAAGQAQLVERGLELVFRPVSKVKTT